VSAQAGSRAVLVIGIGNRYRSDDGAGLAVARRVRGFDPAGADVLELEGEPTSLLDAWAGARSVVVVDAVSSGGEAGAVHRFDAVFDPPPAPFRHRGTHAVSVGDVIELGRALGRLPDRLVAYGIEGAAFAAGEGLSPEVARAVEETAFRVLAEIDEDDR
jgi:hydrogenase maturation protease